MRRKRCIQVPAAKLQRCLSHRSNLVAPVSRHLLGHGLRHRNEHLIGQHAAALQVRNEGGNCLDIVRDLATTICDNTLAGNLQRLQILHAVLDWILDHRGQRGKQLLLNHALHVAERRHEPRQDLRSDTSLNCRLVCNGLLLLTLKSESCLPLGWCLL